MMMTSRFAAVTMVFIVASAHAESAPGSVSLAGAAARRFPQPVLVADLLHRSVLQPVESQTVLGHLKSVVRSADGTIEAVVEYGGVFGIGARPIAVPMDAMALLGQDIEVVGFSPQQLLAFPTYTGSGFQALAGSDTIKVGLTGPSH